MESQQAADRKESLYFLYAALNIVVICLLCEVFVFNARHYITRWGDGQIDMRSAEVNLIGVTFDEQKGLYTPYDYAAIEFKNINKRVVTVYIDAVFDENTKTQAFGINYGSEEHSDRYTAAFDVIRGVEETKYVTLHTSGNVNHVSVMYATPDSTTSLRGITLNKPIPLEIFWPRVLLFSTAAFCIVVIKRKKLFSLQLRNDSMGQNILTAGIMLAFTIYLFLLMLFTAPFSLSRPFGENFVIRPEDSSYGYYPEGDQYNVDVVDALLEGRAHLHFEPTESLLALENPYDPSERAAAGVYPPFDYVYYNGKFYSYFGIVQVLLLSLPYKVITGKYIPTRVAVFIFSALAGVFLMLLWRRLVFRYMKNMPVGMYFLSMLTAAMGSLLGLLISWPRWYEVARASALFFTALGLWLVLGSIKQEKVKSIPLTLGSLCMALAVGCRANYMYFLILIPVILFDNLKEAWKDKWRFFRIFACAAMPCLLVASGLMWWNYIRFGSLFDFGLDYMITDFDTKAASEIYPLGKIFRTLAGLCCYMLPSFRMEASFPFIHLNTVNISLVYKANVFHLPVLGVLSLPATWFLFGLGRVRKIMAERQRTISRIIIAMFLVGLIQMIFISNGARITYEYAVDFMWLFMYGGLVCAYFIFESMTGFQRLTQQDTEQMGNKIFDLRSAMEKIICICMVVSIVLIFFTTFSSTTDNLIQRNNPAVFYSIQRLLGFGI